VIGGFATVMANGEEINTFKTGKGLRQGDPLSLFMFNLHYKNLLYIRRLHYNTEEFT
jgi:hypothetical protein